MVIQDNTLVISGLREYIEFLEMNPGIPNDPQINTYGLRDKTAIRTLLNSPEWSLVIEQRHEIASITRHFGNLEVQYIITRDVIAEPIVVDGKIVWVLKEEFRPDPVAEVVAVLSDTSDIPF